MDYRAWYENISAPFSGEKTRQVLRFLDRLLVFAFALSFAVGLFALIACQDSRAIRFALVPAIVFVLVTLVRSRLDAPRPYEAWPIDPIIPKDTRGKSMPSRHMASAVIIACAFSWLDLRLGAVAFAGCALIAFTRIVGGVHYPRDIVAAAAISAVCGIIGFILVP